VKKVGQSGPGGQLHNIVAEGLERLGDFTTSPRVLVISAIAILVGSAGVLCGVILLNLIYLITNLAYFGRFTLKVLYVGDSPLGLAAVAVPVIGSLIVGLMARFGTDKIRGHGIPEAIEAILLGRSRLDVKVAILKPLSSAIAIGTGGPFGAEGPIIMTGGAVGSLIAQMLPVSDAERKTLLVAGAAAGMTTVFGTPIAAMMLAVELLLFEWTPRSFVPVAAATITAAVERVWLHLPQPLFPFHGGMELSLIAVLCWILVGLLSGLLSGLLTQLVYGCEDLFLKLPIHWMWWPMLGGLVVGLGGLVNAHALGVGYPNIARMLQGGMPSLSGLSLLVVKAIIWAVALGSGTSGGVLAPLLIMGGGLGVILAHYLPAASPGFWALLAMAATMGGTMRSPLTATFFAVELTGNTHVLLPLITACMTAHRHRAADAPLDPDREDRATRPSSVARVPRRSICADARQRGHDPGRGDAARDDDVASGRRLLRRPDDKASELSGRRWRGSGQGHRRSADGAGMAALRKSSPGADRRIVRKFEGAGADRLSGRISGRGHRAHDAPQRRSPRGRRAGGFAPRRLRQLEGSDARPPALAAGGARSDGVLSMDARIASASARRGAPRRPPVPAERVPKGERKGPLTRRLVEGVAGGAHGAQDVGPALLVQRLAQAADVHIDSAGLDIDVVPPDRVEQLLA
jgi:H+/Cl- antiporter ClcA